jgi:hypothetical protein
MREGMVPMKVKRQTFFRLLVRPLATRAARAAIVGRNRSRLEPERGRFTRAEADTLLRQAWRAFEARTPDVSGLPTLGSRMNVLLAGVTLAVFESLTGAGVERAYAIELVGDSCWRVYRWWGLLGRLAARLSGRDAIRDQRQRVGPNGEWPISFPFNPPGYLARYVPTEKGLGFDVTRCPVAAYLRAQKASDLAVGTWCMLDYPLAEMIGLRLTRTCTLAGGGAACDFRWFPATPPRSGGVAPGQRSPASVHNLSGVSSIEIEVNHERVIE